MTSPSSTATTSPSRSAASAGCATGSPESLAPLSPWGRGAGGEGASYREKPHPLTPTPLPQGERGFPCEAAMYPHRIRLRGPWECEPPGGPPVVVTMPCHWAAAGLADLGGRFRCRRRFG